MASRMKIRGLKACVVSGRVRDLAELKESGLPVCIESSLLPYLLFDESIYCLLIVSMELIDPPFSIPRARKYIYGATRIRIQVSIQ